MFICDRPYFLSSVRHILLELLGLFVIWEVSSGTAPVSWGAASFICQKQRAAFFCSLHLGFSQGVPFESK